VAKGNSGCAVDGLGYFAGAQNATRGLEVHHCAVSPVVSVPFLYGALPGVGFVARSAEISARFRDAGRGDLGFDLRSKTR